MDLTMYTGFSSLAQRLGIEKAAKEARRLGFSSVELLDSIGDDGSLSTTFNSVEDAGNAALVLKENGLSVACVSVAVNLVNINGSTPAVIRPSVDGLKKIADITLALGCPYLHHTLIYSLRLPENAPCYEEVLPFTLRAAKEVADYCLPLGLTCLYEEQGFYFNGALGFGKFFSSMKSACKNVGVCGDAGNALFVDEPEWVTFERHAEDIKHVHIKDYYVKNALSEGEVCKYPSRGGKFLLRAPIGKGDVDLHTCLRFLSEAGYSGAFSIEDTDMDGLADSVKATKEIIAKAF